MKKQRGQSNMEYAISLGIMFVLIAYAFNALQHNVNTKVANVLQTIHQSN